MTGLELDRLPLESGIGPNDGAILGEKEIETPGAFGSKEELNACGGKPGVKLARLLNRLVALGPRERVEKWVGVTPGCHGNELYLRIT